MSTTVDSRVVEMRFDNKHFESNVSNTMSTLDKLKQKLHFPGAAKGIEEVGTAAKNVNMSGLGNAVESVQAKFSALQVIGVTALANITNSAVNAGKKMISALTIDPVKTGFKEYELKMDSTKTIMASTGEELSVVNKYLEELNEYSDQTIYSFSDMTQNIGKFTNAGVKLEDAVLAIKGISNEAALSGANANEASRAMYNFAQALSVGYIQRIDWKSIELANMATVEFKEQLLESAIAAGTVKKNADGLYETLAHPGQAYNAAAMFTETLDDQWLTTEVLISTLKDYSDETTDIGKRAYAAAQDVTKFTQMFDILKETAQSGWARTWELIVGDINTAKAILTPLTNFFSNIINTMSDARNRVLQIALDFMEPWKNMANRLKSVTDTVKKTTDKIGGTLSGFQKVVDDVWLGKYNNKGDNPDRYDLLKKAGWNPQVVQELVNLGEESWHAGKRYQLTVKDVEAAHKKFGIAMKATTEETKKTIEETNKLAGAKLKEALLSGNYTEKEIEFYDTLNKKANQSGVSIEELSKKIEKQSDKQRKVSLKNAGYTEAELERYEKLQKKAKTAGTSVEGLIKTSKEELALYEALEQEAARQKISVIELAEEMSNTSGRDLLIESFKNFGSVLVDLGKTAKTAWVDIFDPPSVEVMGIRLYGIIKSLKEFSESIRLTDAKTGELNETGLKFQRVFKGIFAAIDIVLTVVGGPLKIAFKILSQLLSVFGVGVLDIAAFVGDAIVKFDEWLNGILDFTGVFVLIVEPVKKAIEAFKEWINTLKQSENLPQDIANGIATGFSNAYKAVVKFFKNLPKMFSNGFSGISKSPLGGFIKGLGKGFAIAGKTIANLGKIILNKINEFLSARGMKTISTDAIAGLVNGFKDGASKAWNAAVEMVKTLVEKVKGFLGIHSPSKVFMAIGGFIIAGLISGLKNSSPDAFGAFQGVLQPIIDFLKNIDFGSIFAGIIGIGTVSGVYKFTSSIGSMFKGLGSIACSIGIMFKGLGSIALGTGEVLSKSARSISKVVKQSSKVVKNFAKVVKKVGYSIANVVNAVAFDIKAEAITNMITGIAKALLMISAAVFIMAKFLKPGELWSAVGAIFVLSAILVGLAFAMNKLSSASASIDKTGVNIKGLSSGLTGIGMAVLMLGLTIKMLGSMNPDQIQQGFLAFVGVLAAVGAFLIAFMKIPFGPSDAVIVTNLGKTMKKIATALLLMAIVVKILGGMNTGELNQGGDAILGFVGVITLLMLATKLITGSKNVAYIGDTLLKIAAAIGIMALTAKILGKMDRGELIQGGAAILGFVGVITLLMLATKLITGSKNVDKIGGTLLKIGVTIGIMGLVVKLLGGMSEEAIKRGTGAILAFGGIIIALMWATKLASGSKKIGGTILAISGAIAIMAFTALMLSMISWDGFIKGTAMITVFGGIIFALMWATKLASGSKNIGKTMISIAGAIGILALIAVLLGLVPVEKLKQGLAAISILSVLMAGLIAVTSLVKKDVMATLLALAGVIAVLGGILITLSCLKTDSVISSAIALSALLVVLAGVMTQLSPIGKKQKTALKGVVALLALSGVVAALGLVLVIMSALGVTNAIPNVIALSILCLALTPVLYALSLIGKFAMDAVKGVVALAALAVPLALFGLVLAMMTALKVTDAIPNVIALSILCTTLTLLLIPLTLIGTSVASALIGIVALLAMAVPLLAFVGIIALMSGIENGIANAMALTALMAVLGDVLFKISLVAPLALIGVVALTALVGLMTVMGVLAVAIGALMTQFPQLQTFLDVGIPVLVQMAAGLGQMIGAFISALAGEVMVILPQLGLCLGQFMTNAMPFILGAKLVDESVLAGVGILAGAILALTVADLLAGVVSFLQGGSSFADLGTQLSQFMMNAMPFILGAAMITPEMLAGVKALAETILIITAANVLEGLTSFITGGSSLETFAEQLPILGSGLAAFATSLGAFSPEQMATVMCAAQAVKMLASAAAEIPNTGGMLASIVGENDLGAFAAQFPVLGSGLRCFVDNIGIFTDEQVKTVNCAASAIKSLAGAAAEIPNSGGLIASIVGENDLGTFADQFPALGTGLRGFLDNVGTFTDEQVKTVDCAANAIKSLASAASEIPNSGGWVGAIVGENDLGTFADQFPKLGTGLRGFLNNVGTFTDEQIATVDCAANAVKTLAIVADEIPNSGGWVGAIVGENDLGTFADQFPKLGKGLAGFISQIGIFTSEKLSTVNAAVRAVEAITALSDADMDDLPDIGEDISDFGEELSDFCSNMPTTESTTSAISNLNKIISAVKNITSVNSGPLATFADNLSKIGKNAVNKFVEAFTSNTVKTNLGNAAKALGDKVVDGVEAKEKAIKTAGEDAAKKAVDGVETQKDEMKSAGKALVEGFGDGITEKTWYAEAKAKAMANAAEKAAKEALDINSPSKVFRAIGYSVPEGFAMGIDKMGNMVTNSSSTMAKNAIDNVSSSISRISDMVSSDIDAQPTIRPVLDLSNVKSGVSAMNGMLDMDSSVGVRAHVGAISSMMSLRGQNGDRTSEIVSGIKALRKDIANMPRDSVNINGITYSGDSEINNAVQTLVRAARIERRI